MGRVAPGRRGARWGLAVALVTVTAWACAEYVLAPETPVREPRAVQLSVAEVTLDEGQASQLTATVLDQQGQPFDGLPAGVAVVWTSSDNSIASVGADGMVTANAPGTARITAAASSAGTTAASVSAGVVVQPVPTALEAAAGDGQTGTVGDTLPDSLRAQVIDKRGNGVPDIMVRFAVTAGAGSLSADSASTDSTGTAAVRLTLGSVAGPNTVDARTTRLPQAVVTFSAAAQAGPVTTLALVSGDGQTGPSSAPLAAPLMVRAADRFANAATGVGVAWQVVEGGGSVSADTTVTDDLGQASIVWTLGTGGQPQSVRASVADTVVATFSATALSSVATVDVTPPAVTLVAGATQQFTATPRDAGGNPLTGRTVAWSTSDATIATIDGAGLLTAIVPGTITVTATVEGVDGTASVTVTAVPVASVDVTPATATLLVNGTQQFTATPKDADGNPLVGRVVTWTTSDATIAAIDGNGLLTAAAAGTVTVTATVETVRGTASATVTPVPVASVDVTPATSTLAVGNTQQFSATPRDAGGNPLTGRTVAWKTSDNTVATIDNTGMLTAAATGTVTVTATVEGVDGTASVTISAVPVAAVDVTPATSTIVSGTSVQLTATPRDASGTPLTGRTVTWGSSDPTIASVDGTGLVQAVLVGTVTITATAEGIDGTATVTVTPGAASRLAFTVQPTSVAAGQVITPAVQVTVRDAAGNVVPTLAGPVSVGLANNPGGATLGGTTDQDVVSGVATFADLTLDAAGTGYTLVANASGLTGATSAAFDVIAVVPGGNVSWINPAGGNWNDGANWSTGSAPGAGDTALITLSGTYTVTAANAALTVGRLVLGDSGATGERTTLALSNVTLTADDGAFVTYQSVLDLTGGSLNSAAGVDAAGTIVLRTFNTSAATIAAPLTLSGNLQVRGLGILTGALTTVYTSTIEIAAEAADSAVLTVASGFVTDGDITLSNLDATPRLAALTVVNGTLTTVEAANLYVEAGAGGGARVLRAELDNGYRVWVNYPLTIDRPSAAHRNSGYIEVGGGDLTIVQTGTNPSFTNTYSITMAPGRTLTVAGGAFNHTGTLQGPGTVDVSTAMFADDGTIVPTTAAGTGTLTIVGDVVQGATAQTIVSLGGSMAGTEYDHVAVTGTATLGGSLQVSLINGFVPAVGQSFVVLDGPNVNGTFGTTALPALATGQWNVDYPGDGVDLTVRPVSVASVDVTPATNTIVSGTTVQLTATPRDAGGNALTGRAVTWASSDPTIATVDGTGLVTGALAGTATITATSEGVDGTASVTVTNTATWTGATSTVWTDPTNWNPQALPTASVDVQIPVTANAPTISALGAAVKDLTIDPSAVMTVNYTGGSGTALTVSGNLVVGAAGKLDLLGSDQSIQIRGNITTDTAGTTGITSCGTSGTSTVIQGWFAPQTITGKVCNLATSPYAPISAVGPVVVTGVGGGSLDINNTFTPNGHSVFVGGNLTVNANGGLVMTNAADTVTVGWTAGFGGSTNQPPLTNGTLILLGSFGVGAAQAFSATSGHTTIFAGTGIQVISFGYYPGSGPSLSHFGTLKLANTDTILVSGDVFVDGQLVADGASRSYLDAGGLNGLLTTQGANVSRLTLSSLRWKIDDGAAIAAMDSVTFESMTSTSTYFTIARAGDGAAYNLNNWTFSPAPTGAGLYMDLQDVANDANALTVNMAGTTPIGPGGFVRLDAGAQLAVLNGWGNAAVASVDVTPPSTTPASGSTVQLTATPRDAGGNALTGRTVTWASSDPTIASVDGSGLVTGGLVGTATITATSEGIDGTATVTVTPGAASSLAFTAQPSNVTAGQAIAPAVGVTVWDAAGNVVPTLADPVTVAIGNNAGGATLGGTTVQAVVNGLATFADLSLDVAGTGYTLVASAPGLTGATSAAFDVAAPVTTISLDIPGDDIVGVGLSTTLDITLGAPAGAGGATLTVTSDNPSMVSVAAPGTVFIPAGGTTSQITLDGVSVGATTVRANASGFSEGTLTVTATNQIISLPTTLNVPYGLTTTIPVQLAIPAPAGGVTVTLVSSDPSRVSVVSSTVTLSAGATLSSGTLSGVAPGSATITATAPGWVSDNTAATTTADLNVVQTSLAINTTFGGSMTVELRSGGSVIAAPSPGVPVTLTAVNAGCVAVPASVTIPTGFTSTTASVTYGGSAATPCASYVRATSANMTPDSVNVSVASAPGVTLSGSLVVGAGLQRAAGGSLGASNYGTTTVRVTSSNPGVLLVAPNATTAGTAFIDIPMTAPTTSFTYYVQGVEGQAGTVPVTASAPGFTDGATTVEVRGVGVSLLGMPTSTTSLAPNDFFYAYIGYLNAAGTGMGGEQQVRAGGTPLTVTVANSDATVAQLVTSALTGQSVPATIGVGQSRTPSSLATGGMEFDPLSSGTTVVTASIPGVVATPGATQTVIVN